MIIPKKQTPSWHKGYLQDANDLYQRHLVSGSSLGGHSIGIIAIDLVYPKLPGNVVNATTFDFPVLYEKVNFDIQKLFNAESEIEEIIVNAAKRLEADGVRAIIGACGYFANFQTQVAQAVDIPVFLSSLCQLPIIKLGLKPSKKTLVLCADGASFTQELLDNVNGKMEDCVVLDIGDLESFAPIKKGTLELDNAQLTSDLVRVTQERLAQNEEIGAILLECSDLPPYACDIQRATGLPVFDFISMIEWANHAVMQKRYMGYF